jgi:hypothetical protein
MTVGLFVLRVCCFHHSSTLSPAQQQKHFALSWKKMVLCWFGVVVPPEHFRATAFSDHDNRLFKSIISLLGQTNVASREVSSLDHGFQSSSSVLSSARHC